MTNDVIRLADSVRGRGPESIGLTAEERERSAMLKAVEILTGDIPGAAFNAVTEDYPELAELIAKALETVRREVLEEAAKIAHKVMLEYKAQINATLLESDIQMYSLQASACLTVEAAIRASQERPKCTESE